MKKLPPPGFDTKDIFKEITSEMSSKKLIEQIQDDYENISASHTLYLEKAESADLYSLTPCSDGDDTIIFEHLTKNQYKRLYDYYLLSDKKKARKIYDSILINAHEKCPYCGGIGHPKNLDHYLPKASFPQYSILPQNLIPSCRDCNMDGKGAEFAKRYEDQILHPYFDNDKFFNEQWISAKYTPGSPGFVEYYVDPPTSWTEREKQRVSTHFNEFDIALRYSIKAAEELSILIPSINDSLRDITPDEYKRLILNPQIRHASIKNHWKRILFQAIIEEAPFSTT